VSGPSIKCPLVETDYHGAGLDGLERKHTNDAYWAAMARKERRRRFEDSVTIPIPPDFKLTGWFPTALLLEPPKKTDDIKPQ